MQGHRVSLHIYESILIKSYMNADIIETQFTEWNMTSEVIETHFFNFVERFFDFLETFYKNLVKCKIIYMRIFLDMNFLPQRSLKLTFFFCLFYLHSYE